VTWRKTTARIQLILSPNGRASTSIRAALFCFVNKAFPDSALDAHNL
jgi:hypothetical protein